MQEEGNKSLRSLTSGFWPPARPPPDESKYRPARKRNSGAPKGNGHDSQDEQHQNLVNHVNPVHFLREVAPSCAKLRRNAPLSLPPCPPIPVPFGAPTH